LKIDPTLDPEQPRLPLSGVRVLDMTRLIPGAVTTLLLADLGADVVKVEIPPAGDYLRSFEPLLGSSGALFVALNRSKRSVRLDYRQPAGADVLRRLVAQAEVFVENATVGSLERHELDYEHLAALHPRLVYCSITGFGQTGPWAHLPSHGMTMDAASGYLEIGEEATEGAPPIPVAMVDRFRGLRPSLLHAGHAAAMGICAALAAAARSGRGTHIDVSCVDAALNADPSRAFQELNGIRTSMATSSNSPMLGVYRTSDDRLLMLAPVEEGLWRRFCAAIGRPQLAALRGTGMFEFGSNAPDLYREVAQVIASHSSAHWERVFVEQQIPFAPVVRGSERYETSQAQSRSLVLSPERADRGADPSLETVRWAGAQLRFDSFRGRKRAKRPPAFGEHTDAVLSEAGFDASHIESLRASGVI
jgi:crotonobetainyl-CoA:carnitine CoA-transferase CaiB-like acyl-CoA transferase